MEASEGKDRGTPREKAMKLLVLSLAQDDLVEGHFFYEGQQEGVGDYFISCLYSDIESLKVFAGVHSKRFGLYRLLSKRFPFAIYYSIEQDTVSVWRVLDCRRRPSWIRRQLSRP